MSILKIEEEGSPAELSLKAYMAAHEVLTSQTALLLQKFFTRDARYLAPFIEYTGREAIAELFRQRLLRYEGYKLKIRHHGWREGGQTACVFWEFLGRVNGKQVACSGSSEITFDLKGKILAQSDLYDVGQTYISHHPFWRGIYKMLRKKN